MENLLSNIHAQQFFFGAILSLMISWAGWRSQALSRSGALAAFIIGIFIFGVGGFAWSAVLLAFFISSSFLSRIYSRRKHVFDEKFSKGTQRDWGQVLANGFVGAFLTIFYISDPQNPCNWFAFCGAFAAVNADTWATELGVLGKARPRRITNGEPVETGTSGGISLLGYAAGSAGALLIAVVGAVFSPIQVGMNFLWIIFLSGITGSSVDSLLGDTIQAIYYCPKCDKETEQNPSHRCGTATKRIRGLPWLNNDWVNFICSISGAIAAVFLRLLIH